MKKIVKFSLWLIIGITLIYHLAGVYNVEIELKSFKYWFFCCLVNSFIMPFFRSGKK